MNKLYKQVEGYFNRFPEGIDPYKMATRLLEECGEVAREIHHFERDGLNVDKHGEPDKAHFANEIRQALVRIMQIAVYYKLEDSLDKCIDDMLVQMRQEGLID